MRPLSRFRPLLLALALATGAPSFAQDVSAGFDPRTGDVWVDTWLGDINRYGRIYREPFVDELVRYHGAPRELVVELLGRPGWTPGDVYYACSLAAVLGRPCRYVVDEYERDREAGWGALAQRLGIKPGSAGFHRLKRGFVPTYDRWSRPIQLDADLERTFPGRGKAKASVERGAAGRDTDAPGSKGERGNAPPRARAGNSETKGADKAGRSDEKAENAQPTREAAPQKARDGKDKGGKGERGKGGDKAGRGGKG